MDWQQVPMREVSFWTPAIRIDQQDDGSLILHQDYPLPPVPARVTDPIADWAARAPDRLMLADRDADTGEWRKLTYGDALAQMEHLGAWLLARDLSVDRPVMILSRNALEHALMAMAAIHVGIPHATIAPAYALAGAEPQRLREVCDQITPGLVFCDDAALYRGALAQACPDLPVMSVAPCAGCLSFADALQTPVTPAVAQAHQAVTPDTVAKFLFTSGSTGSPKAVINTNRMICTNIQMTLGAFDYMRSEPPVVLDWAPWNHTAGGNLVFYMVVSAGGTLYIDDGRPTAADIHKTVRNLREVSPTWYFNVPVGFDMLIPHLRADAELRESLFRDLKMLWYAGAALTPASWSALEELAVATIGRRILIATGLGSTETAPGGLICTMPQTTAGNVGLPVSGAQLKLCPTGDGKYDARIKGDNVTPGYWRAPDLTAKAFDEQGFYCFGDALQPLDPDDFSKGFTFAGRTAENFKLDTGTWVATGALRLSLLDALGPDVLDVVITGPDRPWLGALVFLRDPALAGDGALQDRLRARLQAHAAGQRGSSTRIRRLMLLDDAPDKPAGEMTDKGSINQRLVLRLRADCVDRLYAGGAGCVDAA